MPLIVLASMQPADDRMPGCSSGTRPAGQVPIEALHVPELDAGFHLLYELKPEEARNQFEAWQKSHPEDPLGSASEAASYLFEECYRQGVLTSEFFLDDKRFLGKIPLKPDPRTARGLLRRGQTGAGLGAAAIEDGPGRYERPVRHGPERGYAGRLCQSDR